ncbi:MAG TPA: RsmE family RNA methyltransferase, partial [bacterium]|nr:RsmE family RNA methyltransferase [bacterium]
MPQFFAPSFCWKNGTIFLEDSAEIHHIVRVHRFRKDDRIKIFDGAGRRVLCRLAEIHEGKLTAEIEKELESNEPETELSLYVALVKRSPFEEILEKGTELGVRRFIPVSTRFS